MTVKGGDYCLRKQTYIVGGSIKNIIDQCVAQEPLPVTMVDWTTVPLRSIGVQNLLRKGQTGRNYSLVNRQIGRGKIKCTTDTKCWMWSLLMEKPEESLPEI